MDKKTRKFLLGGMILNIIFQFVYFIAFFITTFIYGFAMVIALIFGAVISGAAGQDYDSSKMEMPLEGKILIITFLVLALLAFIGMILAIVAFALSKKATNKKKRIAVGVLAIIASIAVIYIPLELIGAIKTLTTKDEQPVEVPQGEVVAEAPKEEEQEAPEK